MTPKSIRSHLAPYSIFSKRRTTVAHAFASALAPSEEYDEQKVELALGALGQEDMKRLRCVYCERAAQTWDHLENLVKHGKLNGHGHQLGNLVPCCRDCNSQKGGKPFREFIAGRSDLQIGEKASLIRKLEAHPTLAIPTESPAVHGKDQAILNRFLEIQSQILGLMEEADKCAEILRGRRSGNLPLA
jgi:hypothetical protein